MTEEGHARIWAKLDEISAMQSRILTVLEEREKNCSRHESELDDIDKRVHKLEINQAKVIGAATLLSVVIGYVLKGLGLE